MFDVITRPPRGGNATRRIGVTLASILAHVAIVAAAMIAPLWYYSPALPIPSEIMAFVAAPPPPPPPPPPPAASPPAARRQPMKPAAVVSPAAAPVEAPARVEPEKRVERPAATSGVIGGVLGGLEGGVPGGVLHGVVGGVVAAPAPPPVPVPEPKPVRVGGQLKAPALIKRVAPEYPELAKLSHVEGAVILEATVDESGHVVSVKVLRSIQTLDNAAVEAVKQWQYSPLRLNGLPVPFVLTVTVQFSLA